MRNIRIWRKYDTEDQNGYEYWRNIQKRRYQCKLKQDQVIAKMNLMGIPISKSSYAKIETNRMNIKVSELVALAKILDCEVGDFFKDLK